MKLSSPSQKVSISGVKSFESVNDMILAVALIDQPTEADQSINDVQNISGEIPFVWVDAIWVDAEWANNRIEELLLKKEVRGANQKLRLQFID